MICLLFGGFSHYYAYEAERLNSFTSQLCVFGSLTLSMGYLAAYRRYDMLFGRRRYRCASAGIHCR